MLDELQVSNIALIEDAHLRFSPGLTVLTGETGAGKTALLSALKLLSGQRADSHVVREGCSHASIEARIIDEQQEEHVIIRSLSEGGRSRCKIDGSLATVKQLNSACNNIRILSQHEHIHLLNLDVQHDYLDAWISTQGEHLQTYRAALKTYKHAQQEYDNLYAAQTAKDNELEYMRFVLSEIDKINPQEGEYEQLEADLPRMQNAESFISASDAALNSVQGDGAALDGLAQAIAALARLRHKDEQIADILERFEEADALLSDACLDLASYRTSLNFEPAELEAVLERLHELSGLMKRFGPSMNEVHGLRQRAQLAIQMHNNAPALLKEAQEKRDAALKQLEQEARDLHKIYEKAAQEFCETLAHTVSALAMEDASFSFSFEPLPLKDWDNRGSEKLELLYSPAHAARKRPLQRIASGGELSRILLAIECMHSATGLTFVFDEVDQGIGGATANAIAQRLQDLSRHAQVICVTHLAQVAACADCHYTVKKHAQENALPITEVHCLDMDERVAEIARMLSGDTSKQTLIHARNMIENAQVRAGKSNNAAKNINAVKGNMHHASKSNQLHIDASKQQCKCTSGK